MSIAGGHRTNEYWLAGLRCRPADSMVVAELRDFLSRSLGKAMRGRGDVSEADIEDFTQDTLVRVLDRIDSFRGESMFTTWATAVAIRVAYTAMRRRSWGDKSLDELGLDPHIASPHRAIQADASTAVDRQELIEALGHAIEQDLTPRQRTVILAELAGMPTQVLAAQLDTNTNALYKLHHDARKKLLASLEQAGFSAHEVRTTLEARSTN